MKSSVYIETSVIGYLTSRLRRELVAAANQQLTREWWEDYREHYDLFVSPFVIDECSAGDVEAAAERLEVIQDIPILGMSDGVTDLAAKLLRKVPLPEKSQVDALHVAVATVNGIEYLLTWNCKHIANATLRPRIEAVCRDEGYEPPSICTPQELMED